MTRCQRCIAIAVIVAAFLVRVWTLDFKPAHFDEGVNGAFIDSMRATGAYHYNPENFHGPLHFYVLFAAQQLFGRSLWVLRMPTVLVGTGVILLLLAFRRFLPFRTVAIAAAFAAVSPAMVFYSRYAIHEMWLPFFALLACYGGIGMARGERRRLDLWCVGVGLAGMVLTKETYLLHWIAAVLASFAVWIFNQLEGSRQLHVSLKRPADLFSGEQRQSSAAPKSFSGADVARVWITCTGLIILFYSGFGFHWDGVPAILETFSHMQEKGTHAEEAHHKEMLYWVKLLVYYEWPALAGFLMAPALASPRSVLTAVILGAFGVALLGIHFITLQALPPESRYADFLQPNLGFGSLGSIAVLTIFSGVGFLLGRPQETVIRWLAFYGLASFAGYALIPYKTAWCSINFLWPFFLVIGFVADRLSRSRNRIPVAIAVLALIAGSSHLAFELNYLHPTNDALPPTREDKPQGDRYAYVQTTFDIQKLLHPVRMLVAQDPQHLQLSGLVLGDAFPLVWELNDFPYVTFHEPDEVLPNYDADFLLIPDARREEIEPQLVGIYFRDSYVPRGSGDESWLYLQTERFGSLFPGRSPDVKPRIRLTPEP